MDNGEESWQAAKAEALAAGRPWPPPPTGLSEADALRLLRLFLSADSCNVERGRPGFPPFRTDGREPVPAWYAAMRIGTGEAAVSTCGEGPTRADAMILAALQYKEFVRRRRNSTVAR